jgi:WD40 repeat protein
MSEAANSEQKNSVLSPPAGFKLRCTLSGQGDIITQIAWSPDGSTLAVATHNTNVKLSDPFAGATCLQNRT